MHSLLQDLMLGIAYDIQSCCWSLLTQNRLRQMIRYQVCRGVLKGSSGPEHWWPWKSKPGCWASRRGLACAWRLVCACCWCGIPSTAAMHRLLPRPVVLGYVTSRITWDCCSFQVILSLLLWFYLLNLVLQKALLVSFAPMAKLLWTVTPKDNEHLVSLNPK